MSKYKPPSGVYFLRDGAKVVYVGQTNDIFRRISEHSRGGQKHGCPCKEFDNWSYVPCEDEELRKRLETLFIRFIQPKYNIMESQIFPDENYFSVEHKHREQIDARHAVDCLEKMLMHGKTVQTYENLTQTV